MVFWLSVIVFIAGIMTYMFFPRNDQYQQDIYQQEGNIVSFVNQHHVAKDLMQQRIMWKVGDSSNTGVYALPFADLRDLTPDLMTIEDLYRVDNVGGLNPTSRSENAQGYYTSAIVCLENCEDGVSGCVNGKKLTSCPSGEQYVVTYGDMPDWWKKETNKWAWFKAILKRTHGSIDCGLLDDRGDGLYSLDNSQKHIGYQTVSGKNVIPPVFIKKLETASPEGIGISTLQDLLFCMTPFKNPYEVTPRFWWDSLNNTGTGTEEGRGAPLQGDLSDVAGATYTIMGVISTQGASNQDLLSLNEEAKAHISCGEDTCTLSIQREGENLVAVSNLPNNRDYAFIYTGSTSKQTLTVYYSYKEESKNKLVFTHRSNSANTGLPVLSELEFRDTFRTNPYLKALRIYDTTLTARQINHNLRADRKRFGL